MWENSRDKGQGVSPVSLSNRKGQGKFHLLTLPHRVRGLALPTPELIDLKVEAKLKPGVHLISTRLAHLLRHTIDTGKQAILLLNRRGYSNFVYCVSCQEPIHCKYCDTTMTYHRSTPVEQSGYVGAKIEKGIHTRPIALSLLRSGCFDLFLPICSTCGKKLYAFRRLHATGVEEEIRRLLPNLKYARVDSDTMRSGKDYETILRQFSTGEIQVLLGTQMIAKGLDYPNVTLVGVISADTALALPDFRSAERTFQLITQVAGRAGHWRFAGTCLSTDIFT